MASKISDLLIYKTHHRTNANHQFLSVLFRSIHILEILILFFRFLVLCHLNQSSYSFLISSIQIIKQPYISRTAICSGFHPATAPQNCTAILAEEIGFEPMIHFCIPVFRTGTLNHSVILPYTSFEVSRRF